MRKQKLSPEASKAKAVRDKKIAMTPERRRKKAENQRIGQKPDSDLHHPGNGEKPVRVSISKNRGNFGKGTKNEGPNMMGQTWLNRKINGPSAIGEMEGYKDDERRYARAERKISKAKEKSPEKGIKVEKKYGYNYDAAISAGLSPDSTGHWPSRDPATGMILKGRKHPTFYKTKAGEKAAGYKIYKKDGDMYSKPKGDKKKGGVKPYVTHDRDDPRIQAHSDSLSAPEKLSNRKPTYDQPRKFTTSLYNPNPIKNSTAYKNYGEVNYGDGTGNKVLNKAEFEAHKKLFKK